MTDWTSPSRLYRARFAVELLVFGSAALALHTTGHRALGAAFVVLVVVNSILVRL